MFVISLKLYGLKNVMSLFTHYSYFINLKCNQGQHLFLINFRLLMNTFKQ